MVNILSQNGQTTYGLNTYMADTEIDRINWDVTKYPMGTKCYVIATQKWYILNSEKEWSPFVPESGGSESGITLETLNVDSNDTYIAPSGVAYDQVNVAVPTPQIIEGQFTDDGEFEAPEGTAWGRIQIMVPLNAVIDRSITGLTISNRVTKIGNSAFARTEHLYNVELPNTITTIEDNAFYISNLTNINFPEGLTSIGDSAFRSTKLINVILPSTLTFIGTSAFYQCRTITSLTFKSAEPPVANSSTSFQIHQNCVIHVPYSADHSILHAYQTATNYPDPNSYTYVEDEP